MSDAFEYDLHGVTMEPRAWLRGTKRFYRPADQSDRYIADRVALENVYSYNGTAEGVRQRRTWYCFDGSTTWDALPGLRGRLTAVRRILDLAGATCVDTTYDHDSFGNQTSVTEYGNYGTAGAAFTQGGARTTSIRYDALGRKTAMTDPDFGTWSYTYHPVGTLATQTDARGTQLSFTHDVLKRLTLKMQGSTALAQFFYDEGTNGKGRRTRQQFGSSYYSTSGWVFAEQVQTVYDRRGRALQTIHDLDNVSYTISRSYDEQDRLLSVSYPSGEVVTYQYGDHGQPVALASSRWGSIVREASYNALGKLELITEWPWPGWVTLYDLMKVLSSFLSCSEVTYTVARYLGISRSLTFKIPARALDA